MRATDQRIPHYPAHTMTTRFQLGSCNGTFGNAKSVCRCSDCDYDEECGEFPDAQAVQPLNVLSIGKWILIQSCSFPAMKNGR